MVRAGGLLVVVCVLVRAEGTEPRKSASDYPVHGQFADAGYAADYTVRTVSHRGQSFLLEDYLVVEAAVFPRSGMKVPVNAQQFFLRLNGKKDLLMAQAPGMAAASVKYPDWSQRPRIVGGVGAGSADVIVGAPTPSPRFPDDNRVPRGPRPPRAPDDPTKPQVQEIDPAAAIMEAALPEGDMKYPVSGYLYFSYKGKLSKIKTVELLVKTGSGEPATLRLR